MKRKVLNIIFVILLLSYNVIAATVSDNDGSAFITKSEFDSLKSNFQSQIDVYNTSLDNKIDNTIASYLSGITVETEKDMTSLLDNNGVYGQKINLKWSSDTNYCLISTVKPYAVQTWTALTVVTVPTWGTGTSVNTLQKADYWSGIWKSNKINYLGNTVTDDTDGTKKEYRVETVKIDGNKYRMLNYVKVVNKFESVQYLGFPTSSGDTYDGANITGWDMENIHILNKNSLTQQNLAAGCWMDYYRTANRDGTQANRHMPNHSVLKTGSSAITQEYTANDEFVFAPFSTKQEYVWDPESQVTLEWDTQIRPSDRWPIVGDVYYDGDIVAGGYQRRYNNSTTCQPVLPGNLYFAWQYLPFKSGEKNADGSDVTAKESIIYNFWSIDNRNWKQKNGLVIGTAPNRDDIEIVCNCTSDIPGTVYFWYGPKNTVIDNWTSADFTGVWKTLSGGDAETKVTLGNVKANDSIWVLFAPTSTSTDGTLKINRLYYKVKND